MCFKRNVHQRDAESIADLAALFEATPRIYTQLLVDSLFDLPKPPQVLTQGLWIVISQALRRCPAQKPLSPISALLG